MFSCNSITLTGRKYITAPEEFSFVAFTGQTVSVNWYLILVKSLCTEFHLQFVLFVVSFSVVRVFCRHV